MNFASAVPLAGKSLSAITLGKTYTRTGNLVVTVFCFPVVLSISSVGLVTFTIIVEIPGFETSTVELSSIDTLTLGSVLCTSLLAFGIPSPTAITVSGIFTSSTPFCSATKMRGLLISQLSCKSMFDLTPFASNICHFVKPESSAAVSLATF